MANILNQNVVKPVFVYLNTPMVGITGNGVGVPIKWDTNMPGYTSPGYNPVTGFYTVPVSGTYLMTSSFKLDNIINGANSNASIWLANSDTFRPLDISCNSAKTTSNTLGINSMIIYNFSAGSSLFLSAQVNSGSSASVGVSAGSSPYVTWLYIRYLG